jgi:hypothetical protein
MHWPTEQVPMFFVPLGHVGGGRVTIDDNNSDAAPAELV